MTNRILSWVSQWWDFIDNRGIVRRIVLGVAITQTWIVTTWAMTFAEASTRPGIDVAAVIGAVSAPVATFGGFVFKSYLDSKPT